MFLQEKRRQGETFFGGAESGCLEACPGDVAGVCGVPPPAAFSAPYRTEGPAGYLKANLLSEPQFDSSVRAYIPGPPGCHSKYDP
jgi:hypothetical protein